MLADLFNFQSLHQIRRQSRAFRWILSLALVYLGARLAIQGLVLSQVWAAGPAASETTLVSNDLQIYLAAANRLVHGEPLYLQEALDKIAVFQYTPAYALFFTPFRWIPFGLVALGHSLINIGAYILLYLWWGRLFRRLGLARAEEMLAWTLPVWIVFAGFWGDLAYLNIYVITALLCTWLIEAVLEEKLGWSLLWISLLLQAKPYLAFPLVLPLILGRPRFFFKLFLLTVAGYAAIVGLTLLAVGPAYGWQQHIEYFRFLAEMTANFPWRDPESDFLGYNHSILQIVFYLWGVTPAALRLATGIKLLLLLPLGWVSLRHFLRSLSGLFAYKKTGAVSETTPISPQLYLDLAFAFYAGAMIWLDIVWEMTLGIVLFAYLLATLEQRAARAWCWLIFLPYALLDIWQVASFVAFGQAILAEGLYIWTDPSIYLPLVMLVILFFYALLVKRLWASPLPAVEPRDIRAVEPARQALG